MKIGFCHGCFDWLHEGHLYFLQNARSHCDYLIVGVNRDDSVRRLKGKDRPIYTLEDRMEALHSRAGAWADAVIPFDGAKGLLLERLQPHVYVHGYDQALTREMAWRLQNLKCEVFQVGELVGHSTSLQIEASRRKTSA